MLVEPSNAINWNHAATHGLVAWWKVLPQFWGGNTFRDLLNRNHGTLTNMDAASDWTGKHGLGGYGSIDLSGSNNYIDCGSAFEWERTQAWTLYCHVSRDATGGLDDFFGNWVAPTYRGWGMLWGDTNKLEVHLIHTWSNPSANRIQVNSTSADTSLDWVRVGATYNGSSATSGVNIYKNGDAVATTALSHSLSGTIKSGGNHSIGSRGFHPGNADFDGQFSEVILYDRALSAAEITQLDKLMLTEHNPMLARIDQRFEKRAVPSIAVHSAAKVTAYSPARAVTRL